MTPSEALVEINNAGLRGVFRLSSHATDRMAERGARFQDVRHGLKTATACRLQKNGRWHLLSTDMDGDELELIVAIDPDVLVVTIY